MLLAVVTLTATALDAMAGQRAPGSVIEFVWRHQGEKQKVLITLTEKGVRVDQPGMKFSCIYTPADQTYTGLEVRDARFWHFTSTDVQSIVSTANKGKARMDANDYFSQTPQMPEAPVTLTMEPGAFEPGNGRSAGGQRIRPATPASQAAAVPPVRVQWEPTGKKKKIGKYDCEEWKGTSDEGQEVNAWVTPISLTAMRRDMDRVVPINKVMETVALRPLIPVAALQFIDALERSGQAPIEVTWGALKQRERDRESWTFVQYTQSNVDLSLYKVPNTYLPIELVALQGLMEEGGKAKPRPKLPTGVGIAE
ncbi:MAG TPA: hypothetical protein VK970_25270 [Candidatus Methylacidiphilales bacterium]|nr:hypothetical protein [Candidatus Methylacidiphilales bacterium]